LSRIAHLFEVLILLLYVPLRAYQGLFLQNKD